MTLLVETALMFVVSVLVSEAPMAITRLEDNNNINQVKLFGSICEKGPTSELIPVCILHYVDTEG